MSIFTLINQIEHFQQNHANDLAGIQSAEEQIKGAVSHLDKNEVETLIATGVATASKGKLNQAQALALVQGVFTLGGILLKLLGSFKLPGKK